MGNELIVSRAGGLIRSALRENGTTVELRAERVGEWVRRGSILKARVSRVVPGLRGAFLDAGLEREVFLRGADLLLPGETTGAPHEGLEPQPDAGSAHHGSVPIEERLQVGAELIVQVVREMPGSKGDRVSCLLAVPGQRLVLFPQARSCAVSRRITDAAERERLRRTLEGLGAGERGFVARTAAEGAPAELLGEEAGRLLVAWERIRQAIATRRGPGWVHREADLLVRLLRDLPRAGVERIAIDDPEDRDRALAYLEEVEPRLVSLVQLHGSGSIDRELESALRRRVPLPSGGHIVLEPTEALVSVDVNTGRSLHGSSTEATSVETNLEAAREIARQLRLRGLGGIVVVDFVAMESAADRQRVLEAMREGLRRDPARTQVVGMSGKGLLHLTRRQDRAPLYDALTRLCARCSGQGRVGGQQP